MKKLFLIALLCLGQTGYVQTIFLETFTNSDGTTTGTDDVGGVSWTATCPYSGAATDYLEVISNVLEARDTNGPAYWETDEIDISTCTEGVTISVDLSEVSTLEGLAGTCAGGCDASDIIQLEVSYDGGTSWSSYSDATYGTISTADIACDCGTCGSPSGSYPVPWCGLVVSGPTITTDDFATHTFSDCVSVGISSTVKLKITLMCWADAEKLRVDNVTLACSNCALPVEIGYFDANRLSNSVDLSWRTLSESENKKFTVQRSDDGVVFYPVGSVRGAVSSTGISDYSFKDKSPLKSSISYYRLEQMDLNGKRKYSEVKQVYYEPTEIYYHENQINVNFQTTVNRSYKVNIYNLSGALVHTEIMSESGQINWNKKGFYFVEIPEIGVKQKLVVQ
jgi:hypothetical protein